MSQSFLSQVLSRKKNLSEEKAVLIADKLKLKNLEKKLFLNLVRFERSHFPEVKDLFKTEIDQLIKRHQIFKVLPKDVFDIISDWYYFAIVELTALKNFKSDVRWISRKLKLPLATTLSALERLERVGLLVRVDGQWKKTEKDYFFGDIPSAAIRKHHHESLELAHKALEQQDMEKREFFTVCFPMDPDRIEEVRSRIRDFCEQLMSEMQETEPKALYKLAVQFFRLDQEGV